VASRRASRKGKKKKGEGNVFSHDRKGVRKNERPSDSERKKDASLSGAGGRREEEEKRGGTLPRRGRKRKHPRFPEIKEWCGAWTLTTFGIRMGEREKRRRKKEGKDLSSFVKSAKRAREEKKNKGGRGREKRESDQDLKSARGRRKKIYHSVPYLPQKLTIQRETHSEYRQL